jgi:hypothetical protein
MITYGRSRQFRYPVALQNRLTNASPALGILWLLPYTPSRALVDPYFHEQYRIPIFLTDCDYRGLDVKHRLLVMNGQCAMQQEDQVQWHNVKVKKARGVKPGIYNIYTAKKADKSKEHAGVILYTDKKNVYQRVGNGQYVTHDRTDFAKLPEPGETKSISYSADGKAVVSEAALEQKNHENLTV